MVNNSDMENNIIEKAKKVKLLFTDCDGVLTDGGIYYSNSGEELKRFSLRDGMGTERLRSLVNIDTAIITGESSNIVGRRAKKLNIIELHTQVTDKLKCVNDICKKYHLSISEIAYIGDDTNDYEVMKQAGLSACPNDAISFVKDIADYITTNNGGYGAYREFVELIIDAKMNH